MQKTMSDENRKLLIDSAGIAELVEKIADQIIGIFCSDRHSDSVVGDISKTEFCVGEDSVSGSLCISDK